MENISHKGHNNKAIFFSVLWTQDPIYDPLWYVMVVKEGRFFQPTLSPSSLAGTSGARLNAEDNYKEWIELPEAVFHPV